MSELETLTGKARFAGLKLAALSNAAREYFDARADMDKAARAMGMRLTKAMDGLPAKVTFKAADFPPVEDEPGLGTVLTEQGPLSEAAE